VLNLPSCRKSSPAEGSDAYRYLGQVAHAVVAPPGNPVPVAVRQVLRDGVVYVDEVWEIAARVVAHLGAFRYSALHIRRNELQYKQVFVSMNATVRNIAPLLPAGEPLYIATDEVSPQFFDALRARHPRLYQYVGEVQFVRRRG
jgi:hypothetical protein